MSAVIAQQGARAYPAAMASALFRLLALVAMLVMPVGIASAPAMAQAAPVAGGHCDGHEEPAKAPVQADVHCMGCSALPAFEAPAPPDELLPQTPRQLANVRAITGIVLEIATPPPKLG